MIGRIDAIRRMGLAIGILAGTGIASAHEGEVAVAPLAGCDRRFTPRGPGWTGGDACYSVPIGKDRYLWLYGDTFIGKVREGRHTDATLISNTIGIQAGKDPRGPVDFRWGRRDGKPSPFFPDKEGSWLWPGDGSLLGEELVLFWGRYRKTDESPFGFAHAGTVLIRVRNPWDDPVRWRWSAHELPLESWENASKVIHGAALVRDGGHLYIYVVRDDAGRGTRELQLARTFPSWAAVSDPRTWTWYRDGRWTGNAARAGALIAGAGAELTVHRDPTDGLFRMVYSPGGLSNEVVGRKSPAPWGPWGPPTTFYRCPEPGWNKGYFCYAAKAHPHLAAPGGGLLVTYVANASKFEDLLADARIYKPRFLRVTGW